MGKTGTLDVGRLFRAARYSWRGLRSTFKHETAFRQELVLVAILTPLALWLGDSGIERALLVSSLLLVLMIELLNSAIEATVDRFGGKRHKLAGRAKDMGSAAVFVALLNAALVWLLVLTH